jgi:hypothetical protein
MLLPSIRSPGPDEAQRSTEEQSKRGRLLYYYSTFVPSVLLCKAVYVSISALPESPTARPKVLDFDEGAAVIEGVRLSQDKVTVMNIVRILSHRCSPLIQCLVVYTAEICCSTEMKQWGLNSTN